MFSYPGNQIQDLNDIWQRLFKKWKYFDMIASSIQHIMVWPWNAIEAVWGYCIYNVQSSIKTIKSWLDFDRLHWT